MNSNNSLPRTVQFGCLGLVTLLSVCACTKAKANPGSMTAGVPVDASPMSSLQQALSNAVSSAPAARIKTAGLAGVVGGVHARFLSSGAHELVLCLPQLTEAQVPLCYAIEASPASVTAGYKMVKRDGSNTVLSVSLSGAQGQEVALDWSALVLLKESTASGSGVAPESYLRASPCAQAEDKQVKTLADKLWPAEGKAAAYAAAIQEFIRDSKQQQTPRSLDAVGILQSGANWICTANANLAAALFRAKGFPCRTMAVVPPLGQRLEMHRIAAWYEGGRWTGFDPSSVQTEVPLKPWQNIIMANTTSADEQVAMQPRMGSAPGCPYAQEIEFMDYGLSFSGNDFFWTLAKPLAQVAPADKAVEQAVRDWERFLSTGKLSDTQIKAGLTAAAMSKLK